MATPSFLLSDRHPSTSHALKLLEVNPNLPEGLPKNIAIAINNLAIELCNELNDGQELTEGLRKLWEAKNSLIVHAVLFNE